MKAVVQVLRDREAAHLDMHRRAAEYGLAPKVIAHDCHKVTFEHAGTTLKAWWETTADADRRQSMKAHLRERINELHEVAICHRDLHSENVMVGDDDVIRFVDFVLAAIVAPDGPCYDLDGPSEAVPVPQAHASQSGHEDGIWWGPIVSDRCLARVVGEQPLDNP